MFSFLKLVGFMLKSDIACIYSCVILLLEKADEHTAVLLHNSKYQMHAFMHSSVSVHALGKSLGTKGVDNTYSPICHLCFLSYSTGYLPTAPPMNIQTQHLLLGKILYY